MTRLLQDWVAQQADARPEAVALVHNGETLTYGGLEARSNRLARLLVDAGCQRGDRVCVLVPKSIDAIVGILGILKADGIYVPLETSIPVKRLAIIVHTCTPRLMLGGGPVAATVRELEAERGLTLPVGWVDDNGDQERSTVFSMRDAAALPSHALPSRALPANPAHILFTSGSTGVPKGVAVTHDSVCRFVEWANGYTAIGPSDQLSGMFGLPFDLSTYDLFGTFAAGATLHVLAAGRNLLARQLVDYVRDAELTRLFAVPAMLTYLASCDMVQRDDFASVDHVMWGGDALPTPTLMHWMDRLPGVRFSNLYGPTETTIASCCHAVASRPADARTAVPIGRPCDGEDLLVLDEALHPSPVGEIGELYIRGTGMSPGYWRDPERTAIAFVPNPHATLPGDRLYRTGDLARVDDDGLFHLLGRRDSQVKSRGFRIELGEIEVALLALDLLDACAVVGVPAGGLIGTMICCAYVPRPATPVTSGTLGKALGRVLPDYMVPMRWRACDRLPTNVNGTVDRPTLRARFQQDLEQTATLV